MLSEWIQVEGTLLLEMIQLERIEAYGKVYRGYAETFHNYMSRYNLLEVVFYDSDRIIIAENIERLFKSGIPYIIRYRSEVAGFIVLTSRHLYRAEINFCTWPPFWGRGSVDRGKEALKQLLSMEENNRLLGLYGFIAASNRAANHYAEQIGFQNAVVIGEGDNSMIFRCYNINRG